VFQGSLVALVTPFDADNRVDDAALKRLIEFHVDAGSDGLVIAGTTGESATLDKKEHADLIRRAVELVDGRLPVIAGPAPTSAGPAGPSPACVTSSPSRPPRCSGTPSTNTSQRRSCYRTPSGSRCAKKSTLDNATE
jgi:4-hydroxy-tetrahydrodipicolinate synthase